MNKYVWVLVFLIGCSSDENGNMEPPDKITEEKIIVYNKSQYDVDIPENIDKWWEETKKCTGLYSEPPQVLIVDDIREYCLSGAQGGYCKFNGAWYVIILSDRIAWEWLWKHEFIHHILRKNKIYKHDHENEIWFCQRH